MKKWLFVGLLLMLLVIPVNASVYKCSYFLSTDSGGAVSQGCFDFGSIPHDIPYTLYSYVYDTYTAGGTTGNFHVNVSDIDGTYTMNSGVFYHNIPVYQRDSSSGNGLSGVTAYEYTSFQGGAGFINVLVTGTPYTLSGSVGCISGNNIKLYVFVDPDWVLVKDDDITASNTSYSYNINYGAQYEISFSDGKEYDFTCTGNEVFNHDDCNYATINIYDECANLLHNQFTWIDDGGTIVYEGHDNPIHLSPVDINEDDKLTVMWTTWLGALQKTCYAQFDHPINLYDPFLYWDMEVYVYDNESNPIDYANVDFNQDCVINGYPARNKFTGSDGMASFTQCENKGANLVVSKDGYKTLSTSISGGWYDAYTPTYQVSVILQSSDSDNSSTWDLINDSINDTNATENATDIPDVGGVPYDINIYFRNMNGDYVNQINDTDNYTRCYYSVNTPDDVAMTLVFQKSFTGYYFYNVYEYASSIDNNSYGYFEIPNSYFNNSDYSYRAYIYDYAYPFDDRYAYLNVVNQTEPYYENLTGYCMFMHTNKNGSIDYREDIVCYAYVESDNNSLETVSLELYDNSTLVEYKNLTYSDFLDDNIYGWYLGHNYILGHNYSLILRGYDGSILDCDNVIAYNLVGNKLTIKVTDSFNHPLSNVYIFCEHYGSINTGWLSYGTFEGLPDGETRYKASKSGYRSGLWSTVNLTSENEIVSYQLIQEKQEGSTTMVRLSDDDAKNLYYPLMYFLLTLMLLGALINVIK